MPCSGPSHASTAAPARGLIGQYTRGTKGKNASCQRCKHPGFPGAGSVCNVVHTAPVRKGEG
eukprot:2959225-Pyramimonas_sp.AAC.1